MSSMRIGAVRAVARRVPGAPRDGARVFVLSTAKRPTGAARLMTSSRSGNRGGARVRASKDDETAVRDVSKRRRAHPLDDETARLRPHPPIAKWPTTSRPPRGGVQARDGLWQLDEGGSPPRASTTGACPSPTHSCASRRRCCGDDGAGVGHPQAIVAGPGPWVPRWRSLPFLVPAFRTEPSCGAGSRARSLRGVRSETGPWRRP